MKSDGTVVEAEIGGSGQRDTSDWTGIGPASEEQVSKWRLREQGLCEYCGGKLSLIGCKCKSCGKRN